MNGRSRLADASARERIRDDLDTSFMCLAGAGGGKNDAKSDAANDGAPPAKKSLFSFGSKK